MEQKLFMILLGCTPQGRLTEQHDMFFGIANSLKELVPAINKFWPEALGKIHIDVWREVTYIDGYSVAIELRETVNKADETDLKLFFINLGGYRKDEFEEYHYRTLLLARNKTEAINHAKNTTFYKHTGYPGAPSHIDDKYGVDVDDIYELADILSQDFKTRYRISLKVADSANQDILYPGYLKLASL